MPSPDMPGRAGGPAIAAVPPSDHEPTAAALAPARAAPKAPARKAKAEAEEEKEANLAPLNFRIPASFRREFKTYPPPTTSNSALASVL